MAAKWRDEPPHACSLPREGTMCQVISSHPSLSRIFFSACLHLKAGLPAESHVPPGWVLGSYFLVRHFTIPSAGPHTWLLPSSFLQLTSNYHRSIVLCCRTTSLYIHFRLTLQLSAFLFLISHSALPMSLSYVSPWSRASRTTPA